jgi:hypothetical protein
VLQSLKAILSPESSARPVFIGVLVIAAVVIFAASSNMYFYSDEWSVLQHRPMGSLSSWLDPHNEVHWIPGLVFLYGLLFNLVGVDHYWLYHLPGVAMHLLAAWMLREIMVLARADAWTATACATLFAFYGTGAQNIMWAFQVGFTGSLAMGLVQLRCATHPVPSRLRDLAGLAAGAVALAFGVIGVTMVLVVGLATLVLRGWRAAFFQTAPLGLIYVLWWFTFVREGLAHPDYGTPVLWADWVWQGFAEVFGSLAGWAPLGALLAAVTVIGVSLRLRDQFRTVDWWRPLVPVLALACGAVAFQLITAIGRVAQPLGGFVVLGPAAARSSRYVYIVAALMLPLIAVAASYVTQRWRAALIVLIPLFVLGLVENVRHLVLIDAVPAFKSALQMRTRELVSDAAYSDLIDVVPAESEVRLPYYSVTAGWLRAVRDQGRLPEVGGVTATRKAEAEAQLAARFVVAKNVECHGSIEPGVVLDFVAGDIVRITPKSFDASVSFTYVSEDGIRVQPKPVSILSFNAVQVDAPHARLMFPVDGKVTMIERCTATSVELQ